MASETIEIVPQRSTTTTVSFHHISYTVENKETSDNKRTIGSLCRRGQRRLILNDVSGKFQSGMNAILGPSGCGKSSLLDVLADRKDSHGLSGAILIDGSPRQPSFRYRVGYVVQEDLCSGTLTVQENLHFSINLRCKEDLSKTEKLERVTRVIEELGLEHCANTRVGTELLRGVSGGEKKRTCIGMELVLSPSILFLDEPTTGLDASTATSIMKCLKKLSKQGKTIIFSIHQPRYSIFKLFDTVMLMCKGRCVFHGSSNDVVPFFSAYGYECEPYDNPADYALDVLIDTSLKPDTLARLAERYTAQFADQFDPVQVNKQAEKQLQIYKPNKFRLFFNELLLVSQRTLRNAKRNPSLSVAQVGVSIVMGVLLGLLYFDMEKTIDAGVQNRRGAFFFIVISQIFINVTAIDPLLKERVLFIHEFASGYYRVITFFISKLLCDLLPMRVIPSILFSTITYFMMNLSRTANQYFIYLFTIFMASLFGSALCFVAAASVSIFAVALLFVILICIIMVMFAGLLLDINSIFNWLSWLEWVSVCRYASNALTINEFEGLRLCLPNNTFICPTTGEQILDELNIDHAQSWDLWKNFVAMAVMTVFLFILAYVQLLRIKKTK